MNLLEVKDALPKGFKLHWYEIQGVLGRGGFGITYLARDTNLDCDVAIKEYFPVEYASREGYTNSLEPTTSENHKVYDWGLDKFVIEARTLAKLSHKNIVRVSSVFNQNKTAYMVMDLESGLSLGDVIAAKTRFTEPQLTRMLVHLMDGLDFVHSKGFIHRDIKPANIILRADGEPVLLDFGSARVSLKQTTKLTSLVSFGYTPFEQYNDSSDQQGPWTDIYALAGTFHSLLLGTKPTEAMARASALMNGQKDPQLPLIDCEALGFSFDFLATLDAGLAFRVDDRPQSVGEWKKMLLDGGTDPKSRKKSMRKTAKVEPTVLRNTVSTTSITSMRSAKKSKTSALLISLSTLVLGFFCLGGGYWFWQNNGSANNNISLNNDAASKNNNPTQPATASVIDPTQDSRPQETEAQQQAALDADAQRAAEQASIDAQARLAEETQRLNDERLAAERLAQEQRHQEEQLADTAKLELERQRLAEDIKQLEEQKRQQQIESEKAAFAREAKNLVANFISAFSRKDHKSLMANNVIARDKQEFVKQLMSAYESFSLSNTPLNINYANKTAQSVISITSIRAANGNIVKPGAAWRDMSVHIRKGPNGPLKLYWQ